MPIIGVEVSFESSSEVGWETDSGWDHLVKRMPEFHSLQPDLSVGAPSYRVFCLTVQNPGPGRYARAFVERKTRGCLMRHN